ncbi:MAG: DUF92 domain-containing protein [Candidatus Hadarchaeales archaeon]
MELISILELLLPVSFGILAGLARFLDPLGAFAASYFGILVVWVQGVRYFLMLLLFFFFATVFTFVRMEYKRRFKVGEPERGRGVNPVMGKGLFPCFFAILGNVPIFVGSLSAALSDTLASELGIFHPRPKLILGFRPVPPGTRGAVSWLGVAGAGVGGMIVGWLSLFLLETSILVLAVSLLSGLVGSFLDSVLGASMPFLSKYEINLLSTLAGAGVGGLFALAGIL